MKPNEGAPSAVIYFQPIIYAKDEGMKASLYFVVYSWFFITQIGQQDFSL